MGAMTKVIAKAADPLKAMKKVFSEQKPPPIKPAAAVAAPKYDPATAVPVGDILDGEETKKAKKKKRRGEKTTPVLTGAAGVTGEAPVLRKSLLGE